MKTGEKDRLFPWVMGWLVFTTLVMPPLVLTRSLVQPTYRWSNLGFSGTGLGGDFWFVLLIFLFVAAMMWYGWRGARMPFHLLAVLWTGTQSILLIKGVIETGQRMRFRGDTLGINIWLGWFVPVSMLFTALTIGWVVRDFRRKRQRVKPAWSRRNMIGLSVAAGLWLVAVVLFPHRPLAWPYKRCRRLLHLGFLDHPEYVGTAGEQTCAGRLTSYLNFRILDPFRHDLKRHDGVSNRHLVNIAPF
jgi:hypothetical protein